MADYSDLLNGYLNAAGVSDQKKLEVAATSEAKQVALKGIPSPADFYRIGAGVYSGKGLESASPLEADLRTLTPTELNAKYGYTLGAELIAGKAKGIEDFRRDNTAVRQGGKWDLLSGGLSGFANGIAGLGNLALGGAEKLGLAPDGSGAAVAQKIGEANAWLQSKQSFELNQHRQANATLQDLDERDHLLEFETTKAKDGKFVAQLRRVGKDALSGGGNVLDDPTSASDVVSSGIGSLFGGGAIGKAIRFGGEALAVRAAVGATGPSRAGFLIAKATEKGAMPAAIAGLEAGGAYQQTADQALKQGATPQEANDAGLTAAAIQAPVAAATGALVSKFEAAPFRVGSLKTAAGDILKETVEEGIQSGAGQLAQNVGLKTNVDPNQDLGEGVGDQIAQGALGGLGTAGALQTPGVAVQATVKTAKAGVSVAARTAGAVLARGDRVLAGVVAKQAQRATDAQDAAVASAPALHDEIQAAVQAKGGEQAPQMADYVSRLFEKAKFDPAEAGNEPPVVQAATQGATDRFTALRQVAQVANDPQTPAADRALAGAYLLRQYRDYQGLLVSDLSDAITQIDDEDPSLPQLRKFEDVVIGLQDHPEIKAALQQAREAAASPDVQAQFSDQALSTPEGQQTAQRTAEAVIELAGADPEKADEKTLDVIRSHAVAGRLNLTDEQKGILETASSLIRETRQLQEQKKALGLSYADRVTQEVQTRDEANASEVVKKSATEHARGVLAALRTGDRDLARERLQDLSLFAQHMQNKVDAFNRNYASGRPDVKTSFQALSPKAGRPWFDAEGVFLNAKSQSSIKLAQQTALDARAVVNLANGMASAFPELGVQAVTPVALGIDPELKRKAADIEQEHRQVRNTPAAQEVNTSKDVGNTKATPVERAPAATEAVVSDTKAEEDQPSSKAEDLPDREETTGLQGTKAEIIPIGKTEAQPVAKPDAVTETVPQPFDDLLGSAQNKNWFKRAFRLPETAKTRLSGLGDQVLATIAKALASPKAFEDLLGSKSSHKLTKEVSDGFQDLLDGAPVIQAAMEKSLADFLAKNNIDGAKPENPAQQWIRGKVLNLVEDRDGKRAYHPELLQSGILAGLQWLVTMGSRPSRVLDEQDVADLLGIDVVAVTDEQLVRFNQGLALVDAKRSLADTIARFWGVEANRNAPIGYTKGIPEAMAAEVLKGMEAAGLIRLYQETEGDGAAKKTFNRLDVVENEDVLAALRATAAFPGAIEQLALTEPEETRFIGEPPKRVAEFQMRNRLVKNTEQQKQAIRAEQATPHFINPQMVSFMETLGRDLVLELFGAGEVDETKLNKNHALSLKGKNATVGGAYDALVGMLAELRNKASVAGVDPEQMPIHYDYNVSRVGRLHMLGLHNPQSSKLMREAILPTRVTLDMSKPENKSKFMLAVAQAWGVKVHKQSRERSVQAAYKLAFGQLAPAVALLSDFQFAKKQLSSADVATLKDAFGKDLSPAAVHAAMEYARFINTDGLNEFKTDLYVEADGVTDGPVNALVHISTGSFTGKWVRLVAKGGLFLGSPGMTVNDFVSQGGENARDLYQTTTDAFTEIMGRFRQDLADPGVRHISNLLLEAMDGLLGSDVSFDGEDLVVQRGIAKNPLTVTIYGSGANGIADKVMGAMLEAFYAEMSKLAQGLPNRAEEAEALIEELTNISVSKGKTGFYAKDVSQETEAPKNRTPQGYTLTASQLANLRQNVLHLFVTPLREAIEATIEDTAAGRLALQEAVQVQSIFLEHAFRQLVEQKLTEKPAEERTAFLSQVELEAIYAELKAMSPLVQTGTQTFFVAGSENADVPTSEFARSLKGDLSSPGYVAGPKDAGVAGIPYLVIGPGDGQMMQNLATMDGAPKGTLKVFDGVHIKLDTLDEDSLKVNQAVHQAWGNNPLAAVNESFQTFLASATFEMSDEQAQALAKALFSPKEREGLSPKEIEARVRQIGADLKLAAEEAQARHDALARVQMSVDHMASAEAPFQSEGESLEGLTEDQIADRLNQLVAELGRTTSRETDRVLLATGDRALATDAQNTPRVLGPTELRKLANRLKAPAELKNLLKEAVRALGSGWEVVRGDQEQTAAYALSKGQAPHRGRPGETINGYTALSQQRVYLHTDEPETLLHELLHATTTQKILDHYLGQTTPEIREAIQHLEVLMAEWLDLDTTGLSAEQRRAYRDALRVVKVELNTAGRSQAENKAAALDEFLAWNLSNQDLIRIAQGKKVENPFARVVKRVLIALKNLIWGRKMAPMVRSDMYSALRFNASVLINAAPTLQSRSLRLVREQSVGFGSNSRLVDLRLKLAKKIDVLLKEQPDDVHRIALKARVRAIQADLGDRVSKAFMSSGFAMNGQEHSTFTTLLTVFATQAKLDPAALARVQELYAHVNKTLTVESFMADPASQDPAARYAAQQKLSVLKGINSVTGRSIVQTDDEGRSTLMPAFLALALVNDEFRQVLSKVTVPKSAKLANDSLDNILTNLGNGAMDQLSRALGEGRGKPDVTSAIDALTEHLAASVEEQENVISQLASPLSQAINGLNDKTVGVLQDVSKKAIEGANDLQAQTSNKAAKAILEVGKAVASIVNEEEARQLAEGWISTANRLKVFAPLHDFLNDLVGRTQSNASVYDMIKKVRSVVQQMRQQFREHLPGLIAQRFSRELTKEEWTHLFKGLAKTDLAALRSAFSIAGILDLLKDDGLRAAEIRRLETLIAGEVGGQNWTLMEAKARQLATFMNTGTPGSHLLRNADAVANLFGVRGATISQASSGLVSRVDQLVSLYAADALDGPVRASLAVLAQDEAEGVSFTLSYLVGQRTAEQQKVTTGKARANHYKGYVPSEPAAGAQLVVAKDSEEARLRLLGYQRLGNYDVSSYEFGAEARGYYFAPLSSRALFNQGIMQNVRPTASGVDPITGHTHDGLMTAGTIADPRKVRRIARLGGKQQGQALMPIFDADGEIVAYERSVDPNQEQRLNRDQNLARMIGVWRGRQAEESMAGEFNRHLVDALHETWTTGRRDSRADEFVNLLDPDYLATDPVVKDAVSLFTPEAMDYIRQTFGGEGFMVRRDMLNDTVGYRSASVGDVWTGTTRLPPEAASVAKRLAVGVFGADAYRNLVVAEKLTQNLVSEARQLIVVKSVVVPVSNFIANIYQMASRGVSLGRVARDMPKKLAETNAYVQRRQRQIELEAELRAAEGNVVVTRRVNAELQSIKDANKRMSIWPLIEAGEFSSISDAGSLEKEELSLYEGRITDFIERQVDKLPPGLRTAGRYALITKDTALFQGMRKAMEYGDFLAKAIRYDHLIQEKKLNPAEALASITEEYVNYDRLSGRFRQGLENIGLLWFWNFKVRIAKIAVATIRENPLHALFTSLVPTPTFVGSIGTPLADNLFTMAVDGDLGWSIGPGMGFRAHEMSPWLNLFR